MTKKLSKKSLRPGVTNRIRKFLWQFPHSSPTEVCRVLRLPYAKNRKRDEKGNYIEPDYRNMVSVEKSHLKEWMGTKIQGRLPKPLLSAHRVEWTVEESLDMTALMKLSLEAEKRRPSLRASKPVGEWYIIPNRNNMREYHDKHVTVRVFPKSGTVRILPGHQMAWPDLKSYVEKAFFMGRLDLEECERLSELLIPVDKHKTFDVGGPVTPFKIDYYKEPLGITIGADGSHPEHIEVTEGWPTWIRPQLRAIADQTAATSELAKQIKLHLSVLRGIDQATQNLTKATKKLTKAFSVKKSRKKKSYPRYEV